MTEYEQLRAALDKKLAADPALRSITKRIRSGTATFKDTAEYAKVLSHILGRELSAAVLDLSDRESIVSKLLRDCYDDINSVCAEVQKTNDEAMGLHLKPQKANYPAERVQQFSHSLIDPTVKDSVIKRRARAGSETITKSFHDDFIKKNAQFRTDAGLKCYIIRIGTKCCDWCTEVAGKYEMGDQPDGIFRRHDNCDCTIIYDGQVLRGKYNTDGVTRGKTWTERGEVPAEYEPTSFTQEQAKELERQNLAQIRGLKINNSSIDNSGRSGIIKPITINDFEERDAKGVISKECKETIINTLRDQGVSYVYDEIRIISIPSDKNNRIEPLRTNAISRAGYPIVVLEINESAIGGLSKEKIDKWFMMQKYSVANSLEEAVIHECAHAKVIDGKTYAHYEAINEDLKGSIFTDPLKSRKDKKSLKDLAGEISKYAQVDGLECIAECHVKIERGETIPKELKELHDKYIL